MSVSRGSDGKIIEEKTTKGEEQNGSTPLHEAAKAKHHRAAQLELKHGAAGANVKDEEGKTPLHWAAKADASEIAEVLIEYGASVDAKDNEGRTPMDYAVRNSEVAAVLSRQEQTEQQHQEQTEQQHQEEQQPRKQEEKQPRERWILVAALMAIAVVVALFLWLVLVPPPSEPSGQEEAYIYEEALYALEVDDPQPLRDFVARHPNSRYVSQAKRLIQAWDKRAD